MVPAKTYQLFIYAPVDFHITRPASLVNKKKEQKKTRKLVLFVLYLQQFKFDVSVSL